MSSLSLQVFVKGVDKDDVVLMAARASRFLTWHTTKSKIEKKVHSVIDNFAEHGLRSLGVARQEVPERNKDSSGGPWEFIALLPLFDPPRHDSAETIRRALELGVSDILHYGKSMENAMRACCKGIKIGKILIHRDGDNGKQAHEGIHYVSKRFPTLKIVTSKIDVALNEEFRVIPGSVYAGVDFCKKLCGVSIVRSKRFPTLKIVTSEIDVALNEEFRVIPGMEEFGDRYFGTDD
ncbi:hypothetical protein AgCh_021403 [Apium graveolens]